MLRRGLVSLIESEPDLLVCGEAATCSAGLEAIRKHEPDLVIVDLMLEASDGLDLVKEVKEHHSKIPVLVLSMHEEALYAERSLKAGARGYVTKGQLVDTVLTAIRRLLDGRTYLSDELQARMAEKFIGGQTLATESPVHSLSDRELQVFRLIGQGWSTREIADTLILSVKTVESHREHIKHKLDIKSASKLVQRATQWVEKEGV